MNQLRCDPINDEEVAKVLPPADESSIHSLHPNKFDSGNTSSNEDYFSRNNGSSKLVGFTDDTKIEHWWQYVLGSVELTTSYSIAVRNDGMPSTTINTGSTW